MFTEFCHTMLYLPQNFVQGLPLVNYPNVCTNSPQFGKAFCEEHLEYLKDKHPQVPTDIRSSEDEGSMDSLSAEERKEKTRNEGTEYIKLQNKIN